jgi:hypothetical protein
VRRRLDHSEAHLDGFYAHIAATHDRLRARIRRDAA